MTDRELAEYTVAVNRLENEARQDSDEAAVVVRQAVALRRALEQLIVARAIQATHRKAG